MMEKKGFAFFVERPRAADELPVPHKKEQEREYEIVKTITLPRIDYENFVTDMLADRCFLEENAALCSAFPVVRCLLVRQRGKEGGILAAPEGAKLRLAAWKD